MPNSSLKSESSPSSESNSKSSISATAGLSASPESLPPNACGSIQIFLPSKASGLKEYSSDTSRHTLLPQISLNRRTSHPNQHLSAPTAEVWAATSVQKRTEGIFLSLPQSSWLTVPSRRLQTTPAVTRFKLFAT